MGSGYEEWINVGLFLRWQCGIRSMERYNMLPAPQIESFTSYWVRNVRDLIARCGDLGPIRTSCPFILFLKMIMKSDMHIPGCKRLKRIALVLSL